MITSLVLALHVMAALSLDGSLFFAPLLRERPLDRLNGEAVTESGDTFVFSGREEKDCEPEPFEGPPPSEEFRLQRDSTAYQRRGD
jgi:hypothetical protein